VSAATFDHPSFRPRSAHAFFSKRATSFGSTRLTICPRGLRRS
jgi:hypothetical protein